MNKLTKVLSVFLLAGALGASVAGATACKKTGGHTHDYQYSVNSTDSKKHDGHCSKDGCDKPDITEEHHWNDQDKCKECGATKPTTTPTGEKLKIPATATKLLVEGVQTETIDLSTTKTVHDIPKDDIKVYFADASGTKIGDAIPAANVTLRLQDPAAATITTWTGLKTHGEYKVRINLQNCEMAEGATSGMEPADFFANVTITINNPVTTLSVKEGATVTQVQGPNAISAGWQFEITRANGDKTDVAVSDVIFTVPVDTVGVGENKTAEFKTTVDGKEVKGNVKYTISADTTKVSQSFAFNFGSFDADQTAAIAAGNKVTLQNGRFEVQSVGNGSIDAHNGEIGTKYFAKRLKTNGSSTAYDTANSKATPRYIKVHADGAGTLTVYAYNNGGAKDDGATRGVTVYSGVTFNEDDQAGRLLLTDATMVGEAKRIPSKTGDFLAVSIPAAGDYYITNDAAMTYCYVQLDQLVSNEGNQAITLDGEMQASALKLNTSEAKTVYKKDGNIDTTGITGEITLSNSVTCEKRTETIANGDLTFVTDGVDMTTLGKDKEVTVEYTPQGMSKVTATYKITVESEVDGVIGASADLKNGFVNTVETADAKLTFKKSDIAVTIDWTKSAVEGLTPTYTVKSGETEIDDATGMEFAIGTHTLTVEIIINDGTNSVTVTKEVTLTVKKKLAPGEVENVKLTFTAADVETIGENAIANPITLRDGVTIGKSNKAKSENVTVDGVTYNHRVQIAGTFSASKPDEKSIKLEVAQAATIKVIYKSGAAGRKLNLYKADGTLAQEGAESTTGAEVTFTVAAGGTFYLGSSNSGINVWQIEIIYS